MDQRDSRIDMLRGYAMLTIACNHVTWFFERIDPGIFRIPTLTYFGFSSAAELFFILSGYMVGLIYLKDNNFFQRMKRRAILIYIVCLVTAVPSIIVCWIFGSELQNITSTDVFFTDTLKSSALFVALLQAPDLFLVLQMYVLLMIGGLFAGYLIKQEMIFFVIFSSFAFYCAVQFFPKLNLPGGDLKEVWRWSLNPFAYQFLFVSGMLLGRLRIHEPWFRRIDSNSKLSLIIVAFFAVLTTFCSYDPFSLNYGLLTSKESLGPVRLAHAICVVLFLTSILSLTKRWQSNFAFKLLATTGQETLYAYAISIVLTYIVAGAWIIAGKPIELYWLSTFAIVISVTGISVILSSRRQAKQKARIIKSLSKSPTS